MDINEPVDITIQWYPDDCVGQEIETKKWYYYDESEQMEGPFDTEHEARISLELYCFFELDGGFRYIREGSHIDATGSSKQTTLG